MRRLELGRGARQMVVALLGIVAVALGAVVLPGLADAEGGPPIVITAGGVYSGHYVSADARTPAVLIATTEPVVLDGATVEGPGTLIQIKVGLPADVTVRNTVGKGNAPSSGQARFLVADGGWRSLVVENNELISTAGIWAHQANPTTIRITNNVVRDIVGRGFVQFAQFDKVVGPIEVAWNEIVNAPGSSSVEDAISLYMSGGTPGSPARIHDNFIWGAFPLPITDGFSGGGIMIGDRGSNEGHVEVTGNQVIGTTNYGISVVCGSNQRVSGNTIISSGRTQDGTWLPAMNVGLSMGSESRWGAQCSTYSGNSATGNDLGWQKQGSRNDSWTPDCADCSGNTRRAGEITYATEQAEYERWKQKTSGRVLGPADAPPPTVTTVAPPTTAAPTTTVAPTTTAVPTTPPTAPPSTTTTTVPPGDDLDTLREEIEALRAHLAELDARIEELEAGG